MQLARIRTKSTWPDPTARLDTLSLVPRPSGLVFVSHGSLPFTLLSTASDQWWGKNVQGKNVQGKNVQGKNVQGKNVQGKNVQGKNVQGKNVQGKNVQGKNVQGKNVQGKNLGRTLHKS